MCDRRLEDVGLNERSADSSGVARAVVVDERVEFGLGVGELLRVLASLRDGEVGHILHDSNCLRGVIDLAGPFEGILLGVPLPAVDGIFFAFDG